MSEDYYSKSFCTACGAVGADHRPAAELVCWNGCGNTIVPMNEDTQSWHCEQFEAAGVAQVSADPTIGEIAAAITAQHAKAREPECTATFREILWETRAGTMEGILA